MALTRSYKETIQAELKRDPEFRKALYAEAVTALLEGEQAVAFSMLRDLIHASISFKRLAEETGGRFHYADKAGKLSSIFSEIVLDLKHQYILGITPQSKSSGFNRMEVKVKKRGAVVYARKGYTSE